MSEVICKSCTCEIDLSEQMIDGMCLLCARNYESMKRREAEIKVKELEEELIATRKQVFDVYDVCQRWYDDELSDLDAMNLVDDVFIAKGQGIILKTEGDG